MLYPKKNPSRWLLLAPLALGAVVVPAAQAKDDRTPPDFLLNRRFEQGMSLFDLTKIRGDWAVVRYTIVDGIPLRRSIVPTKDNATFTVNLDKKFDRFQAWVGTREGGQRVDTNAFRVLGDGQELYKSSDLSSFDAPERINISVKDVSKLELVVEGKGPVRGVFAEPKFVQAAEQDPTAKETATEGKGDLVEVNRPEGGPVGIQVGGKTLDFGEEEPLVRGNRVLVPMRQLFEQIGATVDYNTELNEITAQRGAHRIVLTVGSTAARVDGKLVYLDVPAQTRSAATANSRVASSNETNQPSIPPLTSGGTPSGAGVTASGNELSGAGTPTPGNSTTTAGALGAGSTSTDSTVGVGATAGGAPSSLSGISGNVPGVVAGGLSTTSPTTTQKNTDTTVTDADAVTVDAGKAGPILVPLRFVAEAFNLPVGFQDF